MKLLKTTFAIVLLALFSSCVQDVHKKTISVSVDMNTVENHSQVGIRGNYPLSWEETTYLNDDDNDGIYEGEFEIFTASNDISFKFVTNNDQFELDGQDNRSLTFEYKPEIIRYEAKFNDPNANITKQ